MVDSVVIKQELSTNAEEDVFPEFLSLPALAGKIEDIQKSVDGSEGNCSYVPPIEAPRGNTSEDEFSTFQVDNMPGLAAKIEPQDETIYDCSLSGQMTDQDQSNKINDSPAVTDYHNQCLLCQNDTRSISRRKRSMHERAYPPGNIGISSDYPANDIEPIAVDGTTGAICPSGTTSAICNDATDDANGLAPNMKHCLFGDSSGIEPYQRDETCVSYTYVERKTYNCQYCGKSCSNKSTLADHQRIHTGEKPYKCEFCEYRSCRVSGVAVHQRIHTGEKPYKCDMCDQQFARSDYLGLHRRTHTGEEPYQCEHCGFRCISSSKLIRHRYTRHNEKMYTCNICSHSFVRSSHLTRHLRTHTGEKPYTCEYCSYRCNDSRTLINHRRTHTGEKPYKCESCEYRCSTPSSLVTHRRTHTGEKPFMCQYCEYRCNQKYHLVVHQRIHTGEKPYKCPFCEKKFSNMTSCKKHHITCALADGDIHR